MRKYFQIPDLAKSTEMIDIMRSQTEGKATRFFIQRTSLF